MLCINTDFERDTGDVEPALRQIAEAGFSHVHWCHHWNDDFLYSRHEVKHAASLLARYRLKLCGIHASEGREKRWGSTIQHERLAGLELVSNRMKMAAELGGGFIVLHVPPLPEQAQAIDAYWKTLDRSLWALQKVSEKTGVRIALENGLLQYNAHFDVLSKLLERWEPQFLGLCYDSGHAHIDGDGPSRFDGLKDRLIAMHLHDNDGKSDQHRLPYSGTIDWPNLAGIIATSAYRGPITMELIKPKELAAEPFLAQALQAGQRIGAEVEARR